MDALPPNDPNNGGGNNNDNSGRKEAPYDGRAGGNGGSAAADGAPMDIIGDLRESPAVVVMFLVGVASWFLRERCMC